MNQSLHTANCGTIVPKVCNLTNHEKSEKHQEQKSEKHWMVETSRNNATILQPLLANQSCWLQLIHGYR